MCVFVDNYARAGVSTVAPLSNAINEALFARVVELSQTKSASNAMEKCLRFCSQQQRDEVADKVLVDLIVCVQRAVFATTRFTVA